MPSKQYEEAEKALDAVFEQTKRIKLTNKDFEAAVAVINECDVLIKQDVF